MTTYQDKTNLFQALSHPVRLQILEELYRGEACVCHLQAVTDRPQAYISQQLRILREKGLVIDNKQGQNVFYRIQNEQIHRILEITQVDPITPIIHSSCCCPTCLEKTSQ